MSKDIVQFLRIKDFKYLKEIGQGACGKTVLLKDEILNEKFVCKKYSPLDGLNKDELFKKFIDEIKILHLLFHNNIVRVYNYYLYPNLKTGYIIMEYVEGTDIDTYMKNNPEKITDIFKQIIDGFYYLEKQNILHRDVRPLNLLVDKNGFLKIIDFGFGKQILIENDYDKSVTLNWNCDILPSEFSNRIYDRRSEIYFVGKLFEKILNENDINGFPYRELLNKMVKVEYEKRIESFEEINRMILDVEQKEYEFTYSDRADYQTFADQLLKVYSKISESSKYKSDIQLLIKQLEEIYKANILESMVQNNVALVRCFVNGNLTYYKGETVYVNALNDFINLLKRHTVSYQKIILNNLWNRFDTIQRYQDKNQDDDLPF